MDESSNINNINKDTKIVFIKESKEIAIDDFDLFFDFFVLTSTIKKLVLEKIAIAIGDGWFGPYIVLIPAYWFSNRPQNFTYPIPFLEHKLYIVPYIREVLVYEHD